MSKNDDFEDESNDEYNEKKKEIPSLEKRRLRVIKREKLIRKRERESNENENENENKNKKVKILQSDEEDFDFSQETSDSSSESSSSDSDSEEDEKEMIFYLPPGEYDIEDFEDNGYDIMLENLKQKDKDAYENFLKVKKNIEDKNPRIIDILKLPIHMKDKTKLVELYEVFKETQEPTLEWIQLRDLIVKLQKKIYRRV